MPVEHDNSLQNDSLEHGYFRFPTVCRDRLVFVSEDDLWEVPLAGGRARRLTNGRGVAVRPALSPDGSLLAYTGTEEGAPEVFVMDARGGPPRQLTYDGVNSHVVGWTPEGRILFTSDARRPFSRQRELYALSPEGGEAERLALGVASSLTHQPDGPGRALARHGDDLARWKRYRGGTASVIWVDRDGDGDWQRLLPGMDAGQCRPMWIDDRIFFVSDHEGYGNLYSSTPDGSELRRHTDHTGFYVRFPATDGATIVYARGGSLWRIAPDDDAPTRVPITYDSPRSPLQRKFVDGSEYFEDAALHPDGHALAVTARGKLANFGLWEGAVRLNGREQGVRYRLPVYLEDGTRIACVSDEGGEEDIELHRADGAGEPERLGLDPSTLGRAVDLARAPHRPLFAVANHRYELLLVDLEERSARTVTRSSEGRILGFDFSPDGRWLVWSRPDSELTSVLELLDLDDPDATPRTITPSEFRDHSPVFDPEGRYLYFLSTRHFHPIYDTIFFDLGFHEAGAPCAILLREDLDDPFVEKPRALGKDRPGSDDDDCDDDGDQDEDISSVDDEEDAPRQESDDGDGHEDGEDDENGDDDETPDPVEIDLEGLERRVVTFPLPRGDYRQIVATGERVFFTVTASRTWASGDDEDVGDVGDVRLEYWDLAKYRKKSFARGVDYVEMGADGTTLLLHNRHGLQLAEASGSGPDGDGDGRASRRTGIIDLDRLALSIEPRAEWRQMLREAWRLMRDHYWREDMCGVDWEEVWERYSPLLERVNTRGEFSDLVWLMQGELGTSHAYEFGGDYELPPQYRPGFLGAEFSWVEPGALAWTERGGYRIERIIAGDPWSEREGSPLTRPGVDVEVGDLLLAIDGRPLDAHVSVQQRLVARAGREVELLTLREGDDEPDRHTVRTLRSETPARYREWVRRNRERVHRATDGRAGYVHIPDMGPGGYAEFHRAWMAELHRPALLVDVRNNGGGHVSSLILEKLAREPIGGAVRRWGEPFAYPEEVVEGPMVALTNEYAGSDGDIFSHGFKLLELGPLIGARTWGGVIGIWPRHALVDGSVTTQPEFSYWFRDVGFGLENYGTEPDIAVELPPGAEDSEDDPQLQRAIDELRAALEESEPGLAPPGAYPDRSPPEELPE